MQNNISDGYIKELNDMVDSIKRLENIIKTKTTKSGVFDSSHPNFKHNVTVNGDMLIKGEMNETTENVVIGSSNKGGQYNTGIGYSVLSLNETGNQNCALGHSSLLFNRTGNNNVALGYFALRGNQNSDSTAIGTNSIQSNYAGDKNTAVGCGTLKLNTTGYDNVAIGNDALGQDFTGFNNVAIGSSSLFSNLNGNSLTCVGYGTDVSSDNFTNSTAIGNGAIITASNQVIIGNNSVTSIGGYTNWSNFSDLRIKRNIQENVPGLEFIMKLKPVTYQIRSNIKETGLIAQDVEQAANELNYDFNGIIKPQNGQDLYRLSYSTFVSPLIKAIQEQQEQIEELKNQIKNLQSK